MKRLYWGVGLLLVLVVCLLQWGSCRKVHASRGTMRVTTIHYKLDDYARGRYKVDSSLTEWVEVRRYSPHLYKVIPAPGYKVDYIKISGRKYFMTDEIILTMQHSEVVMIYESPIPMYQQITNYLIYDPVYGRWNHYSSHTDKCREGENYSYTFDRPPYSYLHVGVVRKNDSYYGNYERANYKVDRENVMEVRWYPSETYVEFHPEGGTGTMSTQSGYYGGNIRLNANRFTKKGFRFVGWKGNIDGKEVIIGNEATIPVRSVQHGRRIHLYAQWESIFEKMFLEYNDNSGLNEKMESDGKNWEDRIVFPDLPKNEKGIFLGWSLEAKGKKATFQAGKSEAIATLYEQGEAKRTLKWMQKNVVLPLYSVWDLVPELKTTRVYVPEKWVKEGKVSLDYLEKYIKAVDPEEGVIPFREPKIGTRSGIRIVDYRSEELLTEQAKEGIAFDVEVYDERGNLTKGSLTICVVAANEKSLGRRGKVRLIDEAHKECLDEHSVWRVNEELRALLMRALGK